MSEDVNFVLENSGIDVFDAFPELNRKQSPKDRKQKTKKYFDLLTKEEKVGLYQIYLPDLLMFGYNANDYF